MDCDEVTLELAGDETIGLDLEPEEVSLEEC